MEWKRWTTFGKRWANSRVPFRLRWRSRCKLITYLTLPRILQLFFEAPRGQGTDTLTPSSIETSSTAEAPPIYSVHQNPVHELLHVRDHARQDLDAPGALPPKNGQSRGGPGVCDNQRLSLPTKYLPPFPSPICHRTSATGVLFGSVWVRRSTLVVRGKGSTAGEASGQVEVVTSVIFYPAPWLGRIGLGGHGVEAKLNRSAVSSEWQFKISAVRAVPDDAPIPTMCRQGNVMAVRTMLEGRHASVRDTSPAGWTPLHIWHTPLSFPWAIIRLQPNEPLFLFFFFF